MLRIDSLKISVLVFVSVVWVVFMAEIIIYSPNNNKDNTAYYLKSTRELKK